MMEIFLPAGLQDSVEHDSDTDSELEEISIDEPSAHARRWVTVITVQVRKVLLAGTPRPIVMAEQFNVRAMEIKKLFSQNFFWKTGN